LSFLFSRSMSFAVTVIPSTDYRPRTTDYGYIGIFWSPVPFL
jgi:hypothetical protein